MEVNIIQEFIGKTFIDIRQVEKAELLLTTADGEVFSMHHEQDCCETVEINDIVGDLNDLVGSPILKAEERISGEDDELGPAEWAEESYTWTYYHLATIKGYVDIRWFGSSNGYYSESVGIYKL